MNFSISFSFQKLKIHAVLDKKKQILEKKSMVETCLNKSTKNSEKVLTAQIAN